MSSALQAKMDRLDALLDRKLADSEAQLERDAAADRVQARVQARADAERNRLLQARYSDAFSAFNVEVPPPIDGELPGRYRRRLFDRLVRKLPSSHELAEIRADELQSAVIDNFEPTLLSAAQAEGLRPSSENLPPSGELIARTRVDRETGEKSIDYFGRESFIKSMSRPGRRVAKIVDPRSGAVIWGRNFEQAR
jgi:hypothetical protein